MDTSRSGNLVEREIERGEADRTVREPEFIISGPPSRQVYMRRYWDSVLEQLMLMRVIVEETGTELVVVSVYKTSQLGKYLKGLI